MSAERASRPGLVQTSSNGSIHPRLPQASGSMPASTLTRAGWSSPSRLDLAKVGDVRVQGCSCCLSSTTVVSIVICGLLAASNHHCRGQRYKAQKLQMKELPKLQCRQSDLRTFTVIFSPAARSTLVVSRATCPAMAELSPGRRSHLAGSCQKAPARMGQNTTFLSRLSPTYPGHFYRLHHPPGTDECLVTTNLERVWRENRDRGHVCFKTRDLGTSCTF